MTDFTTLRDEVIDKLGFINKLYFGGAGEKALGKDVPTSGTDKIVDVINVAMSNLTTSSITYSQGSTAVYGFSTGSVPGYSDIKGSLTSIDDDITEINLMNVLGTSDTMYTYLQGLYAWYSVFDANNWDNFKSKPTVFTNIKVPTNTSITSSGITNQFTVASDVMLKEVISDYTTSILRSSKINPFVGRRLMRLYILVCQFLIAYKIYNPSGSADNTKLPLVQACYGLLAKANTDVEYNSAMTPATVQNTNTNVLSGTASTAVNSKDTTAPQAVVATPSSGQIDLSFTAPTTAPSGYTLSTYKYYVNSESPQYSTATSISISNLTNGKSYTVSVAAKYIKSDSTDVKWSSVVTTPAVFPKASGSVANTAYQQYRTKASMIATGSVFNDINTAVGDSISTYNKNLNSSNKVSKNIEDAQEQLTTNKLNLKKRQELIDSQKKYEYGAVAVMAIIAAAAVGIILYPMERNTKMGAAGCLVVVAAINAFALTSIVKSTTVETFASFGNNLNANAKITALSMTANYKVSVLDQMSQYLDNTITLVTLLETYRSYGNINNSMQKELNYFNDANDQLILGYTSTDAAHKAIFMEEVKYSSLLQFFKSFALIISGTTLAYVAFEDVPSIVVWVKIIGVVLAIIAIAIYLLEISMRVHTNPRKYYWGQPNMNHYQD